MVIQALIAHLLLAASALGAGPDTSAASLDSRAADSLGRLGQAAYTEGKYESAINLLTLALRDSADPKINYYLGLSHASLNNLPASLRHLHRAVISDSLNTGYRFQYARMLELSAAPLEAEREYEFIVRHDPAYLPASFQLGTLLYNQKSFGRAASLFSHLLHVHEGDFLAAYYLGMSLEGGGLRDSAARYLALSMTINGRYPPSLIALASLYYADGSFDNALRLYRKALELRPDAPDLYFKAASCLLKLHDEAAALDSSREAADLDSTNSTYVAQLGYVYLLRHHYDSALVAYRKAIALDRDEPTSYINLALTYSKLDSNSQAIEAYQKAIGAYRPENIASVHIRLGTLYYYLKQFRKAAASYQHALDIDPSSKEARFYLALAYDRLNDSRSALRQYRKYLQLAVDDTTAAEMDRKQQARARIDHLRNR